MDPQQKIKSTFVPKKQITTEPQTPYKRKSGINVFGLIGVIVFAVAVLATGGVFGYNLILKGVIDSQEKKLSEAVASFDKDFIRNAKDLDNKIKGSNILLDNHLSPSAILGIFEDSTLATVSFSSLSYDFSNDGTVTISAKGLGDTFNSIVLQSDEYSNTKYISEVLFSGVQRNAGNDIDFSFKPVLDKESILYKNVFGPTNAVGNQETPPIINPNTTEDSKDSSEDEVDPENNIEIN